MYNAQGRFLLAESASLSVSSRSRDRRDVFIPVSIRRPRHFGGLEVRFDATEMQTLVVSARPRRWKKLSPDHDACGLIPRTWRAYDPRKNTCDRTPTAEENYSCGTARQNSIIQDLCRLE
jgi:hypothetical protein